MVAQSKLKRVMYKKPESCILDFSDESKPGNKSRTHQSFKEAVDINNIVSKYVRTGVLSSGDLVNDRQPQYGDYMNIDFVETSRTVAKVQSDFMRQPADVRTECDNDAGKWLDKLKTDGETRKKKEAEDKAEVLRKEKEVAKVAEEKKTDVKAV